MAARLAVLMPVRNCAAHLRASVESVLAQTYEAFELVAIDDDSTDDTADILASYACDSRVRIIRGTGDGISSALELGLQETDAPLIARMDGDDVCQPQRFARQVAFLDDNPALAGLGGQTVVMDETGKTVGQGRFPLRAEDCLAFLEIGAPFCHPAMMLRRDAIIRAGGYRSQFDGAEDVDLWLRMAADAPLANLGETVLQYRIHGGNASRQRSEKPLLAEVGARLEHHHGSGYQTQAESVADLFSSLPTDEMKETAAIAYLARMALTGRAPPPDDEIFHWALLRMAETGLEQSPAATAFWAVRLAAVLTKAGRRRDALRVTSVLLKYAPLPAALEVPRTLAQGARRDWARLLRR